MGILNNCSNTLMGSFTAYGGINAHFIANSQVGRPGKWLNRQVRSGHDTSLPLSSMPTGSYPPIAWRMPITAGAIKAYGDVIINSFSNSCIGFNLTGNALTSIDSTGSGILVITSSGEAVIIINVLGDISGNAFIVGNSDVQITGTATTTNIYWTQGNSFMQLRGNGTMMALGHLYGSTVDVTILTPEQIARAVWDEMIAGHLTNGSTGKQLNDIKDIYKLSKLIFYTK